MRFFSFFFRFFFGVLPPRTFAYWQPVETMEASPLSRKRGGLLFLKSFFFLGKKERKISGTTEVGMGVAERANQVKQKQERRKDSETAGNLITV